MIRFVDECDLPFSRVYTEANNIIRLLICFECSESDHEKCCGAVFVPWGRHCCDRTDPLDAAGKRLSQYL